jgi:hypothetical protein
MAIWLDQLTETGTRPARQPLRDRRLLRHTLELRLDQTDDVLLVLDALPCVDGPASEGTDSEARRMLRDALARTPHELHALRAGQLCVLLPGPITNTQVKRFLARLDQELRPGWCGAYELVFGAARASEARDGQLSWLALSDRRFQARIAQRGLTPRRYAKARGEERRRSSWR